MTTPEPKKTRTSRYATSKEMEPSAETLRVTSLVAEYGFLTSRQIEKYFGYHLNKEGKAIRHSKGIHEGKVIHSRVNGILLNGKRSNTLFATKVDQQRLTGKPPQKGGSALDVIRLTETAAKEYGVKVPDLPKRLLRHDLAVRDVCLWWRGIAQDMDSPLWTTRVFTVGEKLKDVRPDAVCTLALPHRPVTVVAAIEVDMGTERARPEINQQWIKKTRDYADIAFQPNIRELIGVPQEQALFRVLVPTISRERMDWLFATVNELTPEMLDLYWFGLLAQLPPTLATPEFVNCLPGAAPKAVGLIPASLHK
jgi:hypothetical protein